MAPSGGAIEIHLKTAEQLFNSLDPSPFHERDLDREAESYVVGLAREFKENGPLRLIVTLPELAYRTEVARQIPKPFTTILVITFCSLSGNFGNFCV